MQLLMDQSQFWQNTGIDHDANSYSSLLRRWKSSRKCVNKPSNSKSYPFVQILKGQCHEIFDHFLLKILDLGPIWTGKTGFATFLILAKIFDRKVKKLRVLVVNDYTDTQIFLYIQSLTSPTSILPSQRLYQNLVRVVNNYSKTVTA